MGRLDGPSVNGDLRVVSLIFGIPPLCRYPISFTKVPSGQVLVRTRFRDEDGRERRASATGCAADCRRAEPEAAVDAPHEPRRVCGTDTDSSFTQLVELWLEDVDLEGKVAPSARAQINSSA